jgi:hypothetical protein
MSTAQIPLAAPPPARGVPAASWTAGRVVSLVIGSLLLLVGLTAGVGGAAVTWADHTQRDTTGYLTGPTERYTTAGYALRFGAIDLGTWRSDAGLDRWLGTLRVRAESRQGSPVFIGIADSRDVDAYLGAMMTRYRDGGRHYGGMVVLARPPAAPAGLPWWTASAAGTGRQTLTWQPTPGKWTLVVMNADASARADIDIAGGATVPSLQAIGIGLLAGGGITLLAGALLVGLAIAAASRARPAAGPDGAGRDAGPPQRKEPS